MVKKVRNILKRMKKSKKFKLGKIHLNFTNRSGYTLLSIIILVLGAVAVMGASTWVNPSPVVFHEGTNVKITLPNGDVHSLQRAITDGLIGGAVDFSNIGEDIVFSGQSSRAVSILSTITDTNAGDLTIAAGDVIGTGGSADGGDLILTAGSGNFHGFDNGGDVIINPGAGTSIGNVGIGMTDPGAKLTVAGKVVSASGVFANGFVICDSIDFPSSTTFRCNNPSTDLLISDSLYDGSLGIKFVSAGSSLNAGAICMALGGVYSGGFTSGSNTAALSWLFDTLGDGNDYVWVIQPPGSDLKIASVPCSYV